MVILPSCVGEPLSPEVYSGEAYTVSFPHVHSEVTFVDYGNRTGASTHKFPASGLECSYFYDLLEENQSRASRLLHGSSEECFDVDLEYSPVLVFFEPNFGFSLDLALGTYPEVVRNMINEFRINQEGVVGFYFVSPGDLGLLPESMPHACRSLNPMAPACSENSESSWGFLKRLE